jgi:hypothetical protein
MLYDIIGDIHGCYEFYQLLEYLGYRWDKFNCLYIPPKDRILVSVGDIVDRGRFSAVVYSLINNMIEANYMLSVRGNHDDKLMRWAKGNNVIQNHGLDKTILDFQRLGIGKESIFKFIKSFPYYLSLDNNRLIVVHAAWKKSLEDRDPFHRRCKTWCLYGPTTGKTLSNGLPDRIDWVLNREFNSSSPVIVYGHQPYKKPRILNKTYGIDTGCVFGGYLTALRYPEMKFVQIRANEVYDNSKPDLRE